MISDEQLKQWRKLAEKATTGPWKREGGVPPSVVTEAFWRADSFPENRKIYNDTNLIGIYMGICRGNEKTTDWEGQWNDLEFIAASRESVPALIDEVERMREDAELAARLTDALMSLVKYEDRIQSLITTSNTKPFWFDDFRFDVKRAKKILGGHHEGSG